MGKSSEDFIQLREVEQLRYDHTFTKKQAKQRGEAMAKALVEGGEHDLFEVTGNLIRLHEVVGNAISNLKQSSSLMDEANARDGYTKNGVKFSIMNTADRYDYTQDPVYADLQKKLKARESKLKQAIKSDETLFVQGFDEETGEEIAVEIPKVQVKTFGKTVVKVEY